MQVSEKLTINGSADKIWKIISAFDKVETYQSMATKTEMDGKGVGAQRTVTAMTPDGNSIKLVEKLDYLNEDEKTMKISIIGGVPLNKAVVTIKVTALEDNRTELDFDGNIDPNPGMEEALNKGFQFAFQDSARGLEKLASE